MTTKLAFIGGGNMSRSIIGGLVSSGWQGSNISVSDPVAEQRDLLQESFGVNCYEDNNHCIEQADVVIFSVKPQILKLAALSVNQQIVRDKPLLISIAAGIKISQVLNWIGMDLPFIRVMPNTPALINQGVSGLLANDLASVANKSDAEVIMQAVGPVVWVNEEKNIDAVTGISGSGPAYFFKLMEVMIATAIENGLPPETAKTLTLQTALGAANLALDSEHLPAELRRQVTSPKGTTEAAINTMENNGLDKAVQAGINAAIKRSDELANEFGD